MTTTRSALRGCIAGLAILVLSMSCERDAPTPPTAAGPAPVAPRADVTTEETTGPAVLLAAGDIATCTSATDEATAKILDVNAGSVATLGDAAYTAGTTAQYTDCYHPTWGRHKDRTRPTPGNLDYTTAGAPGYFGYFGAAAGDPAKGYYSYDLGDWHIVVLNSSLSMTSTSAQVAWLKADLKANPRMCTLAYWHQPRFYSSGSTGLNSAVKPLWDVLYTAGADVVLNSNYRFYERFAPQKPDGTPDDASGIREFIVGTGGAGSNTLSSTRRRNSQASASGTAGVLKLTLDATGYSWKFLPVAGKTYTDAGTTACHGAPPPVANPGGPYSAEGSITFSGSQSSDPGGNLPLTYAWDFGDGSTGTGVSPSHTYASDGVYTVSLTVTNSVGTSSAPATTTATVANVAPTVKAMTYMQEYPSPSGGVRLRFSFSDPGPSDAPWAYAVDWGDGSSSSGSVTSQASPITVTHVYSARGSFPVSVTVTDNEDGASAPGRLDVVVRDQSNAVVVATAGDISSCNNSNDEATAKLLDAIIAAVPSTKVLTLGDNAYSSGSATNYSSCYNPTWGRWKARTYASLGNHEYDLGNATPSFDYYDAANGGLGIGTRNKGFYSVDIGSWHLVVLNDNTSYVPIASGSEQDQWLQADLAANSSKLCTIGVFHQPYYYSSQSSAEIRTSRKIIWTRLYTANADLVLNGHKHHYERFAPQNTTNGLDETRGMREIIVGTGGESLALPLSILKNSEVRGATYGVLKLTLNTNSYTWEFIPIAGKTFNDFGTGTCH